MAMSDPFQELNPDGYTKVADLSELIGKKGIVRKLGDDEIALVRLEGKVAAFINICPHQHTRLINGYGGQVSGLNLTCPMHGWTYNLETGVCINGSGKLKMLEVIIQDGHVLVRKMNPAGFHDGMLEHGK